VKSSRDKIETTGRLGPSAATRPIPLVFRFYSPTSLSTRSCTAGRERHRDRFNKSKRRGGFRKDGKRSRTKWTTVAQLPRGLGVRPRPYRRCVRLFRTGGHGDRYNRLATTEITSDRYKHESAGKNVCIGNALRRTEKTQSGSTGDIHARTRKRTYRSFRCLASRPRYHDTTVPVMYTRVRES